MSTALVIALVAAAVLALALLWGVIQWRRWPRITAPDVVPEGKSHAVVLVHGFLGFERFAVLGRERNYFHGVPEALREDGAAVFCPALPALGSVPDRAEALNQFLADLDTRRTILIGHSMGGLDSRYAVAQLGANERVSAIVSVGTPHRGTPIADIADARWARLARGFLSQLGLSSEAIEWLREAHAEELDRLAPMVDDVVYGSVVGVTTRTQLLATPGLLGVYELLFRMRGDNDGVVPGTSQTYGRVIDTVRADHFAQIGWAGGFEAAGMYRSILQDLDRGGLRCLGTRAKVAKPTAAHALR